MEGRRCNHRLDRESETSIVVNGILGMQFSTMKKDAARAVFFEYWEVFGFHLPVPGRHDMSAFWDFSSKRRNFGASKAIYEEAQQAIDFAVAQVTERASKTPLSEKVFAQVFIALSSIVKPTALTEATSDRRFSRKKLMGAASMGISLGSIDPARRGEREPVALGVHHRAAGVIRDHLRQVDDDPSDWNPMGFFLPAFFQVGFFLSRGDRLV